jgi:hypothetical protein
VSVFFGQRVGRSIGAAFEHNKGLTKCTPNEFGPSSFLDCVPFFLGTYLYVFLYTWGARGSLFFMT